MTETERFPYFHEVEAPAGAEGWESMYPYFLVPSTETQEEEDSRFWFADTMHWSRGAHPFDSIGAEAVYLGAGQNSTRIFVLPAALGLDVRVKNGYVYISPIAVTDPAEIERRAALFQERAGYYYQHWDELYARWKEKLSGVIATMSELSFPPLGELDPIAVVTEGRGRSTSWDIIENYHRLIDEFFLAWQYHFEFLNLGYGGYIVFFQFCKQAFPSITDQEVARMVAGVDVLAFRPDDELRQLAQLAVTLNVADALRLETSAAVLAAMGNTENGRTWLKAYDTAKDPWFNYFAEYGFTHDQDTWVGNPSIPLRNISHYATRLAAGEDISRPVEQLQAERDDLVEEYRSLLSPEEVAQFDELIALSRQVFPFIEEHNIYVEHWTHVVFWEKMWELGDFLVAAGFTTDRRDVFYFNRFELDVVLFDVVESWAIGVPARGKQRWASEIRRRRAIMDVLQSQGAPPAYGVPPAEVTDPFAVMNYGVTTERVKEWLGSSSEEGDLSGIPGGPGVVEGPVRVMRTENDLADLVAGEILVAPITAPSWAAAFSVATGVITDIGGMMSHAAIVCREYGIPAVVGTGYATARLTTGQRVRLDGNNGVVTVLDGATADDEATAAAPAAKTADYTLTFDNERAREVRVTGGKGAGLAEMTAAGLPVAPGFVVTSTAYRDFLDADGLRADIEAVLSSADTSDPGQRDRVEATISERLSRATLPDAVAQQVREAYALLGKRVGKTDVPVAVRSSATAEDAAGQSFAGEFETWVDVVGAEDVLAHIQKCYASVFTGRVLAYALQHDIDLATVDMAVVVQKTVRARSSGVMFTIDPINGDRSRIVLEASWGLGLAVVGGEVNPDRYVVTKVGLKPLERIAADKHIEYRDGHGAVEVPEERRRQLCLSDSEIVALAGLGKRVEKLNGGPQDLEFAVDEDLPEGDNLILLQCRPETVWSQATRAPAFARDRSVVEWVTGGMGQPSTGATGQSAPD